MADITNPVVLSAVGEIVRPSATAMVARYWDAKKSVAEWTTSGIAALCGNSGTDNIRDEANPVTGTGNGKKQLTAYLCDAEMNDLAAFCTWFEAEGRLARAASVASHLSAFDEANRP
jgi:hypothetical protein